MPHNSGVIKVVFLLMVIASLSCNTVRSSVESPILQLKQTQAALPSTPTPPPIPTQAATQTLQPSSGEVIQETEQPTPDVAAQETGEPPAQPTQPAVFVAGPCPDEVCILAFQFPFQRPIQPPGRNYIDISYRFGTSDHGKRDPHHGVEFLNSKGTPVLAAGDGTVMVAGDDTNTKFGLYPGMYGMLVVLQHALPGFDQPVFTLYAHLSSLNVKEGDTVAAGDKLGEVGSTGAALGSHLHLEVRYGENTYAASRNPELWLRPLQDEGGQPKGALAGRILDGNGMAIKLSNIVLEKLSGSGLPPERVFYFSTYSEVKLVSLPPWEESFAIGDLPPGEYQLSFVHQGMQERIIEIEPGKLTMVSIVIP